MDTKFAKVTEEEFKAAILRLAEKVGGDVESHLERLPKQPTRLAWKAAGEVVGIAWTEAGVTQWRVLKVML